MKVPLITASREVPKAAAEGKLGLISVLGSRVYDLGRGAGGGRVRINRICCACIPDWGQGLYPCIAGSEDWMLGWGSVGRLYNLNLMAKLLVCLCLVLCLLW